MRAERNNWEDSRRGDGSNGSGGERGAGGRKKKKTRSGKIEMGSGKEEEIAKERAEKQENFLDLMKNLMCDSFVMRFCPTSTAHINLFIYSLFDHYVVTSARCIH